MAAAEFVALWQSGACDEQARDQLRKLLAQQPLSGRMIHGFPAGHQLGDDTAPFEDPATCLLSADAWKRCSWVFGPDALARFLGSSPREICLQLGFGATWLDTKLEQGKLFRLAIFPCVSVEAVPATWDGVAGLIESLYPEVWPAVERHLPAIRRMPFESIQAQAEYDMLEANLAGRHDHVTGESSHPNYMSLQRLARVMESGGEPSLVQVRQFLWDEVGLKGLFSGDGHTYDDDGTRGPKEFLARNAPLAAIDGLAVVDVVPR